MADRVTLMHDSGIMEGRGGWFYDLYTPNIIIHYGEEGSGVHAVLCGGLDGGIYQLLGDDDAGVGIGCIALTPSRDQGDTRYQKLYGDIMLDVEPNSSSLAVIPCFDNNTVAGAATTVTGTTRVQTPIPIGSAWQTARNISLYTAWTNLNTTPLLYTWEPRFTEEGAKVFAYSWETCYLTHDLHGYFYHGYLYLVHVSPADLIFTILNEDGTTAAAITITASGGTLHHKDLVRLPVCKGKLFKYRLTSTAQFRVEGQESELLVKPWGSDGPWERKRIFQDVPTGSAA